MIHISNGNVAAKGTIEMKWAETSISRSFELDSQTLHFPVWSKYSFILPSRVATAGGTTGRAIIWLWEWLIDAPAEAPWFLNTFNELTKNKLKWKSDRVMRKEEICRGNGLQKMHTIPFNLNVFWIQTFPNQASICLILNMPNHVSYLTKQEAHDS